MWKDFFFFSTSQRIAILFLLSLIGIVIILNVTLPYISSSSIDWSDSIYKAEFESFKGSLIPLKNPPKSHSYTFSDDWNSKSYQSQTYKNIPDKKLFKFDPNKLDSISFITLGLKTYVVSNILKFRAKGGVFRNKASFEKIYGISAEQYKELEKYIDIDIEKYTSIHHSDNEETSIFDTITSSKSDNQAIIINLNTATANELMQIKGIGPGYSRSIIRYRQLLGGYVKLQQLLEVYGMTAETYQQIYPYFVVNMEDIKKINVNIASIERLKSHPYINFYQAKQIYEYRRKIGKLASIDDLRHLSELMDEDLDRIEDYLEFK